MVRSHRRRVQGILRTIDAAVATQSREDRSWVTLGFNRVGFADAVRLGLFLSARPGQAEMARPREGG